MQTFVNSGLVVPVDEFPKGLTEMTLVPDQHAIKTFPAQGSDQALDVGRGVRGLVGSRNFSDVHDLTEPHIESGSAGIRPTSTPELNRLPQLAVLAVVVVDEELGLLLETRV